MVIRMHSAAKCLKSGRHELEAGVVCCEWKKVQTRPSPVAAHASPLTLRLRHNAWARQKTMRLDPTPARLSFRFRSSAGGDFQVPHPLQEFTRATRKPFRVLSVPSAFGTPPKRLQQSSALVHSQSAISSSGRSTLMNCGSGACPSTPPQLFSKHDSRLL